MNRRLCGRSRGYTSMTGKSRQKTIYPGHGPHEMSREKVVRQRKIRVIPVMPSPFCAVTITRCKFITSWRALTMGKNYMRKAIGALTTGLVLMAVGPVSAWVQFTAGVSTDGQGAVFTGGGTSSGAPISASVVGSGGFDGGSADATALIGVLGAEAHAQEFFFSNVFYDGSASYSDSVVFSGPGSGPISVQFNLHFGGSLAIGGLAAGAFADAHATINGVNVGDLHVGINDGVVERSTT